MVNRKGLGYVIELVVAIGTLIIFTLGQTPTEPVQDWNSFQKKTSARDLTYVLKQTGDAPRFVKNRQTGSLETAIQTFSDRNLEVSGTFLNLPLDSTVIGFHTTAANRKTMTLVDGGGSCSGDLEEIQSEVDGTIKRTQSEEHGVTLYFGNSSSNIGTGYDALWVDNGTACQFSDAEGPYFQEEFFKWGNSTDPDNYDYYDFKDVSGDTFTYYLANTAVNVRRVSGPRLNDIKTFLEFDTLNVATANLSDYDILAFRGSAAVNDLDSNNEQVEDFMSDDKGVIIMANLTEADLDGDFMSKTGFRWMDLSFTSFPTGIKFSESIDSKQLETYYTGLDGGSLSIPPGGKILSANSGTLTQENYLVSSPNAKYDTDEWNATDYSMPETDPSTVSGEPESTCYSSTPDALTQSTFSFETDSGTEDLDVINVELGDTVSYCSNRDVRGVVIDRDKDGNYGDEELVLTGETIIVNDRKYVPSPLPETGSREDGEALEFIYIGNNEIELVNYRTSFEGFQGSKIARLANADYNDEQRKLISSIIYWMTDDSLPFGEEPESSTSTLMIGGVKNSTYIPYKVVLRWH